MQMQHDTPFVITLKNQLISKNYLISDQRLLRQNHQDHGHQNHQDHQDHGDNQYAIFYFTLSKQNNDRIVQIYIMNVSYYMRIFDFASRREIYKHITWNQEPLEIAVNNIDQLFSNNVQVLANITVQDKEMYQNANFLRESIMFEFSEKYIIDNVFFNGVPFINLISLPNVGHKLVIQILCFQNLPDNKEMFDLYGSLQIGDEINEFDFDFHDVDKLFEKLQQLARGQLD